MEHTNREPPVEPHLLRAYPIQCRACAEFRDIGEIVEGSEEWGKVEREDHVVEWGILANCVRCEEGANDGNERN